MDWFRVLADLSRSGVHDRQVATRLCVGKTTVVGWKSGAEPRYSDGDALLRLWSDTCAKDAAQPPMRDVFRYT